MEKAIQARRTRRRRIGRRTRTTRWPLAVLTWASVGRAYDGRNQLMVASEARKARGQRERAKRRMASFSSSDMDLHIYLEHI